MPSGFLGLCELIKQPINGLLTIEQLVGPDIKTDLFVSKGQPLLKKLRSFSGDTPASHLDVTGSCEFLNCQLNKDSLQISLKEVIKIFVVLEEIAFEVVIYLGHSAGVFTHVKFFEFVIQGADVVMYQIVLDNLVCVKSAE